MWARAVRAGFLEEAVGGGRSLLSPRPCSLISAHLHTVFVELNGAVSGQNLSVGIS